jgi:hypothetical protein
LRLAPRRGDEISPSGRYRHAVVTIFRNSCEREEAFAPRFFCDAQRADGPSRILVSFAGLGEFRLDASHNSPRLFDVPENLFLERRGTGFAIFVTDVLSLVRSGSSGTSRINEAGE